jgi:glyoxylase-like metal-dependent hydrolase (beta-lactamase superfamily II)
MNRSTTFTCLLLLSLGAFVSAGDQSPAPPTPSQPAGGQPLSSTQSASVAPSPVPALSYRLEKVAEGVYCAVASGVPYYVSNSVVIVGDDGVAVVDSGAGPNEARVLLAAVRTVTDLPVRYLIDTHFHFDHAFGNEAFVGALIIGHDATREMLGTDALLNRTAAGFVAGLPAQIEKARADGEKETDPQKRVESSQRASALEAYQKELAALRATPPALTFSDRLTLRLGTREIRLLHLGRGHTAGDVVVFLPQERIVCTGDLFNGAIGYMGDAYVDEWPDTLERLAALDFETVIPGHGAPFEGKDAIAPVQACQRDLWRQVEAMKREGVRAEQAAARIDLRAHAARFPRFAQVGFEPLAVRRMYEVIDERAAAARGR